MGIKRKIKKNYNGVAVPEMSRVLPEGSFVQQPAERSTPAKRRYFRPALAAMLAVCVITAGLIGAFALRHRFASVGNNEDGKIGSVEQNGSAGSESAEESYNDGVIGGKPGNSDFSLGVSVPEYAPGVAGCEEDYFEGADITEHAYPYGKSHGLYSETADGVAIGYGDGDQYQYRAGTLTAGEWRDVRKLAEWIEKFDDSEWVRYSNTRGLSAYNVIEVRVSNGDSAVVGAKAELLSASGAVIFASVTDIEGRAYLVYPEKEAQNVSAVRACGNTVPVTSADRGKCIDIEAEVQNASVKELDLMLMVDTTGSMGDELEYLKVELENVVSRIAANGDALSIRVSVNFYRDEGDEYVVRYFDFRTDIQECLKQIREQYASGGGDYPEAVHTALENAVNGHEWRENAVKLCFLVLDAPPHTESEIQGINSRIVKTLTDSAEKGVRIIPVASSGIDKETEVQLRSYAVMTGGTYIFLTNHSGIGNGHIEASVGEYNVEPLNECMVRVACEYCGLGYEAPEKPETSEESPVIVDGQ